MKTSGLVILMCNLFVEDCAEQMLTDLSSVENEASDIDHNCSNSTWKIARVLNVLSRSFLGRIVSVAGLGLAD